jgi:hypothetical protein
MAINSFGQGVAPSAVPNSPTTATATTSATTTDVTVTWTPDTTGAVPTAYVVTGTASSGVTTTVTTNATSVILANQSGGRAYTFTVRSQNAYGNAPSARSTSAVTPPFVYKEALVATTTANYTIPTGYSKMAAIVYGGAGNGVGTTGYQTDGGKGGGGAGAVAFQEYAISATQVYTITVGAAGGQSKITAPDTTIIAAATGGAQGGTGVGVNAGGVGTSQVAASATITGGNGGGGSAGGAAGAGQAGTNGSATSFTVLTAYGLTNPVAVALGGGGGGGTLFRNFQNFRYFSLGASTGGAGGASGTGAGAAGATGSTVSGAGGGFVAGSTSTGSAGRVIVYVA